MTINVALAGAQAVGKTSLLRTLFLFARWVAMEMLGLSYEEAMKRIGLYVEDVRISEPTPAAEVMLDVMGRQYIPSLRPDRLEAPDIFGDVVFHVAPGHDVKDAKKRREVEKRALSVLSGADIVFFVLDSTRVTTTLRAAVSLLEKLKSLVSLADLRRKQIFVLVNKADKLREPPRLTREVIVEIEREMSRSLSPYGMSLAGVAATCAYVEEVKKCSFGPSYVKSAIQHILTGEVFRRMNERLRNNFLTAVEQFVESLQWEF